MYTTCVRILSLVFECLLWVPRGYIELSYIEVGLLVDAEAWVEEVVVEGSVLEGELRLLLLLRGEGARVAEGAGGVVGVGGGGGLPLVEDVEAVGVGGALGPGRLVALGEGMKDMRRSRLQNHAFLQDKDASSASLSLEQGRMYKSAVAVGDGGPGVVGPGAEVAGLHLALLDLESAPVRAPLHIHEVILQLTVSLSVTHLERSEGAYGEYGVLEGGETEVLRLGGVGEVEGEAGEGAAVPVGPLHVHHAVLWDWKAGPGDEDGGGLGGSRKGTNLDEGHRPRRYREALPLSAEVDLWILGPEVGICIFQLFTSVITVISLLSSVAIC